MFPYREFKSENLLADQTEAFINYRQKAGRMASEHWHTCGELLFVFGGEASQSLNGERLPFLPGEALYIAPGAVHSTTALEDDCYIGVIQFYYGGRLPSLYLKEVPPEMAAVFSRIQEEFALHRPGYALTVRGLTLQALGLMERFGSPLNPAPATSEAEKAAEFLRSRLTQRVTLEQAAKAAGYSPTYYSRLFRQWMGISFKAYLDQLKIQAAKGMLADGMPAGAAAEMLGYETPSSFCRAFKRVSGETPSGYAAGLERQKMDSNS